MKTDNKETIRILKEEFDGKSPFIQETIRHIIKSGFKLKELMEEDEDLFHNEIVELATDFLNEKFANFTPFEIDMINTSTEHRNLGEDHYINYEEEFLKRAISIMNIEDRDTMNMFGYKETQYELLKEVNIYNAKYEIVETWEKGKIINYRQIDTYSRSVIRQMQNQAVAETVIAEVRKV